MTRFLSLLVFVSTVFMATAHAQLALFTFDGSTETPAGSIYNYGNVAAGNNVDLRVRARDVGTSSVVLTNLSISGNSFSIVGAPSLPYTIAPGNFLEFTVRLAPLLPGTFSATLQVASPGAALAVMLLATAVAAPVLGGLPPCSKDNAAANQVDFASVQFGQTGLCNFTIQNLYTQPLVVSSVTVAGTGFQVTNLPVLPTTIAPGSATSLTIQITPVCGTTAYSGTLTVKTPALTQTFFLAAFAAAPPLSKPGFVFNPATFSSGEQVTLTITLPAPYPCPALISGFVNLAFTPATKLVTDDAAIVFLPGSTRSLPLTLLANSTQMSIGGKAAAIFQTGTTAGSLTFSVATTGIQLSADPTTVVTIPPAPIAIDVAAASNQKLGNLNVEVTAVDNTYTAGPMSFAFLDTSGKTIGSGPITADFTAAFKTYFASSKSGGAFLMNVSFPISGNQFDVGSVQVTLTNSAGQVQTGILTFQ